MIGPKCAKCGKQFRHHSFHGQNCPIGKRMRNFGYMNYDPNNRFEAKEPGRGGASEKRKDRTLRRAVKSEPCCACGTKGTDWNPVDPAHIRTFKVTQSDHPANLIPLCRECHKTQHRDGWGQFIANNYSVAYVLMGMGWEITDDPFQKGRVILSHPEVA